MTSCWPQAFVFKGAAVCRGTSPRSVRALSHTLLLAAGNHHWSPPPSPIVKGDNCTQLTREASLVTKQLPSRMHPPHLGPISGLSHCSDYTWGGDRPFWCTSAQSPHTGCNRNHTCTHLAQLQETEGSSGTLTPFSQTGHLFPSGTLQCLRPVWELLKQNGGSGTGQAKLKSCFQQPVRQMPLQPHNPLPLSPIGG